MTNDLIATIRARHATASAKLNRLRPQVEGLEREIAEYETALKVLGQVSQVEAAGTAQGISSASARSDSEPSMPDLILRALEHGPKPIAEVTALVSGLSDKPVDPNNIRSTAWRMWKNGRIEKTGDDYHLIGHGPDQEQDDFEDFL